MSALMSCHRRLSLPAFSRSMGRQLPARGTTPQAHHGWHCRGFEAPLARYVPALHWTHVREEGSHSLPSAAAWVVEEQVRMRLATICHYRVQLSAAHIAGHTFSSAPPTVPPLTSAVGVIGEDRAVGGASV